MKSFAVGSRRIGSGEPCFIAAEIGINHNGDMALARSMIAAAAEAGASAVKFQNYYTEDFLSDRSLTYEYVSGGKTVIESQFDMFKRCELSAVQLGQLRDYTESRGVEFFSTPTSERGLAELAALGAPLVKNGSDYLGHLPLIRAMARTGIPTVLSTGMATLEDIEDAVQAYRGAGGRDLVLLHCTSSYPTPDTDVNLNKIITLTAAFDCHVGFSDHTWGTLAAQGACMLRACFIEKHFTTSQDLPGPDHGFSSTPEELAELVSAIRRLELMRGEARIGPVLSEAVSREQYRLSCVAAADLLAGHVLGDADIIFRRPGNGIPPKDVGRFIGRKLAVPLAKGQLLDGRVLAN
jgi:N-acetylneuraminate synthase/N,N'-diacetyllegionaminate synthase